MPIQDVLHSHEVAIAAIEKYFEFGYESEKDKARVMDIINKLQATVEHS